MALVQKQNNIDFSEIPEKVTCARCGFPVDKTRDSKCPLCERENYQEPLPADIK